MSKGPIRPPATRAISTKVANVPLSACIELLFTEGSVDPAERIRRAAAAGVVGVEFWLWRHKNIDAIATAIRETEVRLVSFMSEHEALASLTEQLVDPDQHDAFVEGLKASCEVANRLGCHSLVVHSGDSLPGVDRARQHAAIVALLRRAGPLAGAAGIRMLLEPLNTAVDHPGHFLSSTAEGLDIVQEVDHPNVALLYDLYHSVSMSEVPSTVLAGRLDRVAHVQLADAPGRHEPGTGAIDWRDTLGWLLDEGYQGLWGLEYFPSIDSTASIAYITEVATALSMNNEGRLR